MTLAYELQAAVQAALAGEAALSGWAVTDGDPAGETAPFISIGPDMIVAAGAVDVELKRCRFAVTLWSAGEAAALLKPAMAAAERAVLVVPAALASGRVARMSFLRSYTRRDARAGLVRGEVEFEAMLQG